MLHIASYGSISSIQMLTPAADQRGPAQGKVTQLNLSRLRHYEFGPVALKKHLSSQMKFDASTITPSFLLFSNCCPPTINLVYCSTMYCYSCPRMSQGCMIAHACWIGMISSCYCSQLDTQKMIQNAMSLQTLLGINLRTLHSPPLACSFPIERTNCFVHTHTHAYTFMHTWRRTCMHQYIATLIYTCIHS